MKRCKHVRREPSDETLQLRGARKYHVKDVREDVYEVTREKCLDCGIMIERCRYLKEGV